MSNPNAGEDTLTQEAWFVDEASPCIVRDENRLQVAAFANAEDAALAAEAPMLARALRALLDALPLPDDLRRLPDKIIEARQTAEAVLRNVSIAPTRVTAGTEQALPLAAEDSAIYEARDIPGNAIDLKRSAADARDALLMQSRRAAAVEPHKDSATLLIDTINATGGVLSFANGTYAPRGDPDWIDLGDAYVIACAERGVNPVVTPDGDW